MVNDLLVSVIIPVFNTREYIEEALLSVLGQTYSYLEIILVDDGSTDGSDLICDDYERRDKRIKVVHQPNKGLSIARNVGLDIASGQLIAFLDPDDAMHPEMIKTMVSKMMLDGSDIVMCKYSVCETEGEMKTNCFHKDECKSITINQTEVAIRIAEWKVETAVWNKLYKRHIWENIRFPEGRIFEGTYIVYASFSLPMHH